MSFQILEPENNLYAQIIAVEKALPSRCIKNEDLVSKGIDTSHEWIVQRTGIHQRYIAESHENSSFFAIQAAEKALKASGLDASEIQAVVLATSTPDFKGFPSVACLVQSALNLKNAFAFDVSAACSGFSYAMTTANQFLMSSQINNVLVVAVDCLSEILNWEDRSTCVLFGDGAGAIVLQKSTTTGLLASLLGSDGNFVDVLSVKHNSDHKRVGFDEANPLNQAYIHMDGRAVFKLAVEKVAHSIDALLSQLNVSKSQLKKVVLHQANQRILNQIQSKCAFSEDQMVAVVSEYGNVSAASIPIALADIQSELCPGDLVLMAGFGAGFTWGVNLVEWTK